MSMDSGGGVEEGLLMSLNDRTLVEINLTA